MLTVLSATTRPTVSADAAGKSNTNPGSDGWNETSQPIGNEFERQDDYLGRD